MKNSKVNLIILILLLAVLFYGSSLVISSTVAPLKEKSVIDTSRMYLRSLKMQLHDAVAEKKYDEGEIFFRRIIKLDAQNQMVIRLGSVICYHNGKLNEAENMLRGLLLRNPWDFVCRNNYGMVLMAKKDPRAFSELKKAWEDSGKSSFIRQNLERCAQLFKVKLPTDEEGGGAYFFAAAPVDAITLDEEK